MELATEPGHKTFRSNMPSVNRVSALDSDSTLTFAHRQDMQNIVINFLRAQNQKKSPLLKLPTELIIQIGELVFDSDGPTRVHGMVSRNNAERNPIFLIQTCSLLRSALRLVFLDLNAFVVTAPSPTATEVALKIGKWSDIFDCAISNKIIKPKIFVELIHGHEIAEDPVELAKRAESLAQTTTFRPRVFVQTRGPTGLAYFASTHGSMRLHPPPTDVILEGASNPYLYGAPPPGDREAWKGWVATVVNKADVLRWQISRYHKPGPQESFWRSDIKMLIWCKGDDST